jgi:hypothetical protein
MSTDRDDPVLDAMVEAEIARAIGPGADALPPEILHEVRCLLRIGLLHHPGARGVLEHLRPAPAVEKSDTVATTAFKNRRKSREGGGR